MKAQSIIKIQEILETQRKAEQIHYKSIRHNLEEKYGTEWLDNVISQEEKDKLYRQKQTYDEINELYEDFMNHNW